MTDLFRDVDEALEQEKAEKLWKEHGPNLIMMAVVIVLATAIYTGFKNWDTHRDQQETSRVMAAIQDAEPISALEEIAANSRRGHQTIATFTAAGTFIEDKNTQGAYDTYKHAIEAHTLLPDYEDLARVMLVRLSYNLESADKPGEILEPVIKNSKSPWHYHAKMESAMAGFILEKNQEAALATLQEITNSETAPQDLKDRAKAFIHVLGQDLESTQKTEGQEG